MSTFHFTTINVPSIQGTKRKASNIENVGLSQCAPPTCLPIKLEPGSPIHFDCGESNLRDTHPELDESATRHSSRSRSDDMEGQMFGTREDEGTVTPAEVRLDMSSRDVPVPLKKKVAADTDRVALQYDYRGTTDLLRPSPILDLVQHSRRHEDSGKRGHSHPYARNVWEDVDYNSIPDYAPPISTLPSGDLRILQVEWRERTLVDLSNDPDQHILHEMELKLATSLNLCCAKYLCTKRRIFQARLEALRAGRVFKKADSARACRINVNKISKLHGAFEKVGLFDEKYFLDYLAGRKPPSKETNSENENRGSVLRGRTEFDIWEVNGSETHFTSERDEESTDDDTADSSVSADGRYGETGRRTDLDSYRDNSLRKQHCGLSLIRGDGSQRRVLNDRTLESHGTVSEAANVDQSFMFEDRRSQRAVVLEETANSRISDSPSGHDTENFPTLKTRSMTQTIRLALDSQSGPESDQSSIISIIEPDNGLRVPIPHSLDEANAADLMLVEMKKKGRSWLEIEEALEKETGKARNKNTLSYRYRRIMAEFAGTRVGSVKTRKGDRTLTYHLHEPDDTRDNGSIPCSAFISMKKYQLLAAEAEVEANFQREKAKLIAEIENNFQAEKWKLVAKAMSRTGRAKYSAESIQANFERLTRDPEKADAGEEEGPENFSNLPRLTTRAIRGKESRASVPSRSDVEEHNEASNALNLPQPQHSDSTSQANMNGRGKRSADRSYECKNCGREYKSPAGLIYHHEISQSCGMTRSGSPKSRQKKSNSYSYSERAQPRAIGQRQFACPSPPLISFSSSVPRQTHTKLLQAHRVHKTSAPKDISLGPFADETARRRQKVQDDHAKQSARSLRAWATRQALGTNDRRGGPPTARTIAQKSKASLRNATLNAGSPLALQSQSDPERSFPKETAPVVTGKEVRCDTHQHQQSLGQIIPPAPQTDSGRACIKPFRKVSMYDNLHL